MRKEQQSHRAEKSTKPAEKTNGVKPIFISQEELAERKKQAEAQIQTLFSRLFAQQDLTKALLIDEADIPQSKLPSVPHQKVYPFVIPAPSEFFGKKTSRPDFKTLYTTLLYKTRMALNNKKCFRHEDIKRSIIVPTLCKDNILYCKEGELLHQISLDGNNPRFVTHNLLTKKDSFLCEDKMSEILASWLEEDKAYDLYNKLVPLYKNYTKGTIQPLNTKTLPTIQQAYVLNVYRTGYEAQFNITNNVYDENFMMPPTLCDSKAIISKAGDRYYKIDFNDEVIRFEKLIQGTRYLMSSTEANLFINKIAQRELFGTKTGHFCAWLKSHYNKEIAPLCQEDNLVSATALDEKTAQRKKLESDNGFRTIQEMIKNINQRINY